MRRFFFFQTWECASFEKIFKIIISDKHTAYSYTHVYHSSTTKTMWIYVLFKVKEIFTYVSLSCTLKQKPIQRKITLNVLHAEKQKIDFSTLYFVWMSVILSCTIGLESILFHCISFLTVKVILSVDFQCLIIIYIYISTIFI